MSRTRVIYQSEALYTSKSLSSAVSGEHAPLDRVQSANYSFSVSRQDINQYGELARIDSLLLEPPTVNLDFSYYLTNGTNEKLLSFGVATGTGAGGSPSATTVGFASGLLNDASGKNFYIATSKDAIDINDVSATGSVTSVIAIGNGFVSNYSVEMAVGSLPTVSVTVEGANIAATGKANGLWVPNSGIASVQPAVSLEDGTLKYPNVPSYLPIGRSNAEITSVSSKVSALRPGDITLNFGSHASGGSGVISDLAGEGAINIQSASLSIPFSRTPIQKLGSKFAYSRPVDFPVTATLSVNAVLNEVTSEILANALDKEVKSDISITIKNPNDGNAQVVYTLKNCKLDSESFSSSIGSNKAVDLVFSSQVGGANDTGNGIFMWGREAQNPFT